MKIATWLVLLCGIVPSAYAANGRALHDAACMQCHASLMSGKANAIYTRSNSKITSKQQLAQQVTGCMVAADVQWKSEQKQAVIDYLARQFYGF